MFQIQLTEEQINYLLNLLAERPFKEVYELVGGIRGQAQQQIQAAQQAQSAQELQLPEDAEVTVEEVK
jgi:hypothetical protein